MTPNWPQFANLTATPELFAAIDALGVEVPPEGRPRRFQGYRDDRMVSVNVERHKDSGRTEFVVYADGSSRYLCAGKHIRQVLGLPFDGPTHKALVRWLRWWGLEPSDTAPPAPHEIP